MHYLSSFPRLISACSRFSWTGHVLSPTPFISSKEKEQTPSSPFLKVIAGVAGTAITSICLYQAYAHRRKMTSGALFCTGAVLSMGASLLSIGANLTGIANAGAQIAVQNAPYAITGLQNTATLTSRVLSRARTALASLFSTSPKAENRVSQTNTNFFQDPSLLASLSSNKTKDEGVKEELLIDTNLEPQKNTNERTQQILQQQQTKNWINEFASEVPLHTNVTKPQQSTINDEQTTIDPEDKTDEQSLTNAEKTTQESSQEKTNEMVEQYLQQQATADEQTTIDSDQQESKDKTVEQLLIIAEPTTQEPSKENTNEMAEQFLQEQATINQMIQEFTTKNPPPPPSSSPPQFKQLNNRIKVLSKQPGARLKSTSPSHIPPQHQPVHQMEEKKAKQWAQEFNNSEPDKLSQPSPLISLRPDPLNTSIDRRIMLLNFSGAEERTAVPFTLQHLKGHQPQEQRINTKQMVEEFVSENPVQSPPSIPQRPSKRQMMQYLLQKRAIEERARSQNGRPPARL